MSECSGLQEIAELRMRSQLEDVHHQLVLLEHTKLDSVQSDITVVREKVERLMGSFKVRGDVAVLDVVVILCVT